MSAVVSSIPSGLPTSMPSTATPSHRPITYWVIYSTAYAGPPDDGTVIFNWAMIAFAGFILVHRYYLYSAVSCLLFDDSAILHGLRFKSVRIITDVSALAMLLSGIFLYLGKAFTSFA